MTDIRRAFHSAEFLISSAVTVALGGWLAAAVLPGQPAGAPSRAEGGAQSTAAIDPATSNAEPDDVHDATESPGTDRPWGVADDGGIDWAVNPYGTLEGWQVLELPGSDGQVLMSVPRDWNPATPAPQLGDPATGILPPSAAGVGEPADGASGSVPPPNLGELVQQALDGSHLEVVLYAGSAPLPVKTDAYGASNEPRGIRTFFDDGAAHVFPYSCAVNAADWSWRVSLNSYGFGDEAIKAVDLSVAAPAVNGTRVDYVRENIVEWYINEPRGLKQGFTIQSRPPRPARPAPALTPTAEAKRVLAGYDAEGREVYLDEPITSEEASAGGNELLEGGDAPTSEVVGTRTATRVEPTAKSSMLELVLDVETSLTPELNSAAGLITYRDAAGLRVLTYSELVTVDARGRELPSSMMLRSSQIVLAIDDADAVYPITIDPIIASQTQYIYPGLNAGDRMGWSVSITAGASCPILGDLNQSGAVDSVDVNLMTLALNGPDRPAPQGVDPAVFARADFDTDGDVDLGDVAAFQLLFSENRGQ